MSKPAKVKKPPVTNLETLPPLLPAPTAVVCPDHQPLPPLLPTLNPVRVAIDKLFIIESEFEEFIYQVEEPEDYVSDEEIQGDDIKESSN